MRSLVAEASLAAAALAAGCAAPPAGVDSPDPHERLRAVAEATRRGDREAVPALVRLLDSDDPAVRMFSIRALERLTGTTLGYDHAAPEASRREAVARWVTYVEGEEPARPGDGESRS
jgi:hypothetical protein